MFIDNTLLCQAIHSLVACIQRRGCARGSYVLQRALVTGLSFRKKCAAAVTDWGGRGGGGDDQDFDRIPLLAGYML